MVAVRGLQTKASTGIPGMSLFFAAERGDFLAGGIRDADGVSRPAPVRWFRVGAGSGRGTAGDGRPFSSGVVGWFEADSRSKRPSGRSAACRCFLRIDLGLDRQRVRACGTISFMMAVAAVMTPRRYGKRAPASPCVPCARAGMSRRRSCRPRSLAFETNSPILSLLSPGSFGRLSLTMSLSTGDLQFGLGDLGPWACDAEGDLWRPLALETARGSIALSVVKARDSATRFDGR